MAGRDVAAPRDYGRFFVPAWVVDSMAIILILVPLFAPIVVAQGFDLV